MDDEENIREFISLYPEFNQKDDYICVEYPGVVKNEKKMLKTFGGMKMAQKVFRDPQKRLELYYRPEDPCCKCLYGNRTSSNALVLKVKKYKKKNQNPGEPPEFMYRPEIIGVVDSIYRFTALCDFQYLPLSKEEGSDKLVSMLPYLSMKREVVTEKMFDANGTQPPLLVCPQQFSRFDKPQQVMYMKNIQHRPGNLKTISKAAKSVQGIGVFRKKRQNNAIAWDINDSSVPDKPLDGAVELTKSSIVINKEKEDIIKSHFEERPIWSKTALLCITGFSAEQLRILLPATAYYYFNGPWRSLWVRLGYDPRMYKESIKYQHIEFRLRQRTSLTAMTIKPKRSPLLYKKSNAQSNERTTCTSVNLANETDKNAENQKTISESSYMYKPGVLPPHRQMYYQYIDIQLPEIQALIDGYLVEIKADKNAVCGIKNGWLPDGTPSMVREILTADVMKTKKNMNINALEDVEEEDYASDENSDNFFEDSDISSGEEQEQ